MGYGLPAAIAAALVHRERRVVALLGDGGLGMTLAEIETAVREGAQVVVIVFDNERYGMIRAHQDRAGSARRPARTSGRSTSPPPRGRAAPAASGSRPTPAFEPALRDRPRRVRADGHPAGAGPPLGSRRPAGDGLRSTCHASRSISSPEATWDARDPATPYLPAAYAEEGSSTAPMATTRWSRWPTGSTAADPRPFLLLTLDLERMGSPWRFDDPERRYPHMYGPIDPASVVAVRRIDRTDDGRFARPVHR